jgi:hypothetical protein
MKLHFPNPSRSFDEKTSRILFWGYDRTIEVSFFLEAAALKRLFPKVNSTESELLKACVGRQLQLILSRPTYCGCKLATGTFTVEYLLYC